MSSRSAGLRKYFLGAFFLFTIFLLSFRNTLILWATRPSESSSSSILGITKSTWGSGTLPLCERDSDAVENVLKANLYKLEHNIQGNDVVKIPRIIHQSWKSRNVPRKVEIVKVDSGTFLFSLVHMFTSVKR